MVNRAGDKCDWLHDLSVFISGKETIDTQLYPEPLLDVMAKRKEISGQNS
jgi:hypothetical protein